MGSTVIKVLISFFALTSSLSARAGTWSDMSTCMMGAPNPACLSNYQAVPYNKTTPSTNQITFEAGYECCGANNQCVTGYGCTVTINFDQPTDNGGTTSPCSGGANGSIVNLDDQTVGESIPITGADFSLNYSSRWAQYRTKDYSATIPVTGNPIDTGVTSYDIAATATFGTVSVTLGTASISNSTTGINYTQTWNGLDSGSQPVLGSIPIDISITPDSTAFAVHFPRLVGTLKSYLLGFGGWLPTNYHFYDYARRVLYRGDSSVATVDPIVLGNGDMLVPETDGSLVYEFDSTGKHLYTKTGFIGTIHTKW